MTALVRDAATSRALLRRLGAREVVERVEGEFDLIIDAVGGAAFGLAIEHVASRGLVVNLATGNDDEVVSFRAQRFDRAHGARIVTLNLFDELATRGGAARDLARLVALMADGRLDGQVELTASWREPAPAFAALLERRIGGKAVLNRLRYDGADFLPPAASAALDTCGVDDALPASWEAFALGLAEAAEGTRADVQASTATVARPMRLADDDASILGELLALGEERSGPSPAPLGASLDSLGIELGARVHRVDLRGVAVEHRAALELHGRRQLGAAGRASRRRGSCSA